MQQQEQLLTIRHVRQMPAINQKLRERQDIKERKVATTPHKSLRQRKQDADRQVKNRKWHKDRQDRVEYNSKYQHKIFRVIKADKDRKDIRTKCSREQQGRAAKVIRALKDRKTVISRKAKGRIPIKEHKDKAVRVRAHKDRVIRVKDLIPADRMVDKDRAMILTSGRDREIARVLQDRDIKEAKGTRTEPAEMIRVIKDHQTKAIIVRIIKVGQIKTDKADIRAIIRDHRTADTRAIIRDHRTADIKAIIRDHRAADIKAIIRDHRAADIRAIIRDHRAAGSGYQGNNPRPQGSGYQGNNPRPQGSGYGQGGNRPAGQGNNNFSRPGYGGGQRPGGGFSPRNNDEFKKDEDDKPSYNRGQGAKKGTGGQRSGSERKNFDQQILDQKVAEKNDFSNKRNRDRINKEKSYKDKNLIERDDSDTNIIKKILPKKGQFIQPKPIAPPKEDEIKVISIPDILTIKELADKMKMPSSALVKKLFLAGKMVSINQEISYEEAEEIALGYEIITEKEVKVNEVEELLKEAEEDQETQEKRPPVVCVMGHVDHGKTSLLDAIRETSVTSREAGGITQHIGAYVVEINGEKITFLDTPGHEAFTSMRMRGAKSTDIAILVVAADDGVMPQTIEAISHAKAAGVQIIVAINKIDKPSANVERVKQELTEYELVAEDWGGDTIFVPVSAHTKEGIDRLLEMILLTAEITELKANPNRNARGIVIEAELDKGRGPVATILVQKGTLNVGDNIVVGASFGKVRAMMDDKGRRVKEATPSTPVEILGLNEVPDAGETFLVTDNEKEARTIAEAYISQGKERLLADTKAKLSLDGLFSQIQAGNIKELNLIIKADVQGSVEAMKQSLLKLSNEEVAVRIIHGGVGAINESDVKLASTSNAIIIGFNVKPDNAAKETADREEVDMKFYRVIYNAINDIEAAMKGLLDPVFEERIIGHADIRQTFKASGIGTIAGSYVLDGKIIRGSKARIYRDNSLAYDGILSSLKRFQDDVKEVAAGYECGLVFDKYNDVREGDKVELYVMVEVPR
ncbi:MAG: infB [Herbinix sp.]|nr:infB [Herbinix sp.]